MVLEYARNSEKRQKRRELMLDLLSLKKEEELETGKEIQ
jgi:hypothetical protein